LILLVPNKSKRAKARPLYKTPPPQPERGIHSASSSARPSTPKRNKFRAPADDLHATPVPTHAFVLRDDGTIGTPSTASARSESPAQHAEPVLGAPPAAHLTPDTPHLIHSSDTPFLRLYHGNSLELLDAIAAKYPEGRFDMIFADPPYFLSQWRHQQQG
jgi:hypothetical protein